MVFLPAIALLLTAGVGASAVAHTASSMTVLGGARTTERGGSHVVSADAAQTPGARPEARSAARQLRAWLRRGLEAVAQADGSQSAPAQSAKCPVVSEFCKIKTQGWSSDPRSKKGTACMGTCYDSSRQTTEPCASLTNTVPGVNNFCTEPCVHMGLAFEAEPSSQAITNVIDHCRDASTKWAGHPVDMDFVEKQDARQAKLQRIMFTSG